MKTSDVFGPVVNNPIISGEELKEIFMRRRETAAAKSTEEAMQKVNEARLATTQTTLEMMDRHIEIVRESHQRMKEQARKRDIELLAQKRKEDHTEMLAEMAIRKAERRDLLEIASLKRQEESERLQSGG